MGTKKKYKTEDNSFTIPVKSLVTLLTMRHHNGNCIIEKKKNHILPFIYLGYDHLPYSFTDYIWKGGRRKGLVPQRNTEDQHEHILINKECKWESPVVAYIFFKVYCIPSLKSTQLLCMSLGIHSSTPENSATQKKNPSVYAALAFV